MLDALFLIDSSTEAKFLLHEQKRFAKDVTMNIYSMNPVSQSGAAVYAQTTNVVAQFTNQIQVFNTSVSYFKKINISNNNNTGNDNDSDNAGAHQLEPLSPLIS